MQIIDLILLCCFVIVFCVSFDLQNLISLSGMIMQNCRCRIQRKGWIKKEKWKYSWVKVNLNNYDEPDADVLLLPGEEASPEGGGVRRGAETARGAGRGEEESLGGDAGAAQPHRQGEGGQDRGDPRLDTLPILRLIMTCYTCFSLIYLTCITLCDIHLLIKEKKSLILHSYGPKNGQTCLSEPRTYLSLRTCCKMRTNMFFMNQMKAMLL